jgi:LAS superfamily LD-carboxypeptidase LdcB
MPNPNVGTPVVTFSHNLTNAKQQMETYIAIAASTTAIKNKQALADSLTDWIQGPSGSRYSPQQVQENVKEANRLYREFYALSEAGKYKVKTPASSDITRFGLTVSNSKVGKSISSAISGFDPKDFYELMEDDNAMNLDNKLANSVITPQGGDTEKAKEAASGDPVEKEVEKLEEQKEKFDELAKNAKEGSAFLGNISLPYYVDDDYNTELGIIGNIYVNVKMLYDLAIDASVESQDKKEKNEIALYDFIKNMLAKISPVIGNVNNFDILTDSKNNAQIVDINLVSKDSPEKMYEDAFPLQLHNLNSTVRSYKLESKIFPEQSTIVAIGAQVEGGALGTDTTTFVAFNRSIRDRIIPVKNSPPDKLAESNTAKEKLDALLSNLETLYLFFGRLKPTFIADADFDVDKAGNYQNALKDLINYLRAITTSKTSNKAILPTVLSIVMDGIGGLIIGNLFKTNTDILPKGYKGSGQGGIGPNVGYIVTGIGHTVGSGDWTTSIDAQTIILDSPKAEITDFDYSNITINVNATKEKEVVTETPKVKTTETKTKTKTAIKNTNTGGTTKTFNGKVYQNGKVDELLVRMDLTLEKQHITKECLSDGARVRLQAKAMQNLEQMIKDAKKDKIHLGINSAYRTRADQDRVFDTNCSGVSKTGKCIPRKGFQPAATPGRSNHGFGLAVDLANAGGARVNPKTTPKEWKWIQANKSKYSFENINTTNESHHYNFYG